jgi:hypothetical protein
MSLMEDMFKGNLVTGIAVGLGALVLGPVIVPAVRSASRFAAKSAVKGGLRVYRAGRDGVTGTRDFFGGIVAEARREMAGPTEEKTPGHPIGTPHEVS